MNAKKLCLSLWITPVVIGSTIAASMQASSAAPTNVACKSDTSTPRAIVTFSEQGKTQEIAILSFLPQYFSSQVALENCQKTAATLQTLYSTDKAKYLTAQKLNEQTVVCAVERRGMGCDRDSATVLFAIDGEVNPSQALYDMLGNEFKQAHPPSSRTVSRIYSDIQPRWLKWPW
ncbi:MAG: COP23 domain-containing protein [Hydrococcus sp. Prado102]|nr:COP23 domain-containing protein [Hydrococcus sp. Prado102]